MDKWIRRKRRRDEIKSRAARPNHMYRYCRVIGCGKSARAGTSDGLDTRYCRSHADHFQRHGSLFKKTYPAKVLNPYRRAALAWLEANEQDLWVRNAIDRVRGLYERAGQHEEALGLRGKKSRERASIHWGRLRKAGINPRFVIAAWLSIEMVIRDDHQPVSSKEFKRVQGAKLVHRMASGTHKRWEQEVVGARNPLRGKVLVTEMHIYPRSRGRVLRHIGQDLEEAVELLVENHLEDIRHFKKLRDKRGLFNDRPFPKGQVGRRRTRYC